MRRRTYLSALLTSLLAGCASDLAMLEPSADSGASETDGDATNSFFLEVRPTPGSAGDVTLLPETFGSYEQGDGFRLVLRPARRVTGVVTADRVTPWLGLLPTERVPVPGQVLLRSGDGRVVRSTRTAADGSYELLGVPGDWRLGVTPDDPRVAAWSGVFVFTDDARGDLTLSEGVPIWGRVEDASGDPIEGAVVRAIEVDGVVDGEVELGLVASGDAVTDAEGWYELRVEPGVWVVQTTGRPGGRDPVLRVPPARAEEGARVDVQYPTASRSTLTARIVDPGGRALSGVRVRVSSQALDGYDEVVGSFQVDVLSDSKGYIDTRLPAGTYRTEVLPQRDDPWSALTVSDVRVRGEVDLGALSVSELTLQGGIVLDPTNLPVAGASVRLTERTSEARTWVTTTDLNGLYEVPTLAEPADLEIVPISGVNDLAPVHIEVPPGELPSTFQLPVGERVGGVVLWQGDRGEVELAGAEVRVLDAAGVARGYAVTDDAGVFTAY
ncbi:MAG TPA: carboxypeptidase-like regulatory domain-containing protein, partial [Myxococcota bacterium]|nr:carboxypeptidase-like regulatory domain-containing protein [Myxococcota bacterium]